MWETPLLKKLNELYMIETIKVISELWPLVSVLVVCLFFILFKNDIKNILERVAELDYSDGGLNIKLVEKEGKGSTELNRLKLSHAISKVLRVINYKEILDNLCTAVVLILISLTAYFIAIFHDSDHPLKEYALEIKKNIVYDGEPPKKIVKDARPTALMTEIINKNLKKAENLILSNPEIVNTEDLNGHTPLHIVSNDGHTYIAKVLLENGADPNEKNINGQDALMYASRSGYTEIAKLLIDYGADVYSRCNYGCSPLINAVKNGHYEIVELLVAKRSHVNDHIEGHSALMSAVRRNYFEISRMLLEKNADVDYSSKKGVTALMYAVVPARSIEMVDLLLEHHANPDIQDDKGRTALIYAALNSELEIAKKLVGKGADLGILDEENKSALDYALDNEDKGLILFLESEANKAN